MNKLHGYIEIDINGEKVPLKFGLYAIDLLCDKLNIAFSDLFNIGEPDNIFNKSPFKAMAAIIWAGAEYASTVSDSKKYTLIECYEIMETIGINSEVYNNIALKFWSSLHQDTDEQEDDKLKIKKNKE